MLPGKFGSELTFENFCGLLRVFEDNVQPLELANILKNHGTDILHSIFGSELTFENLTWRARCWCRFHNVLNLWHDSYICVTWLIHMGDMTHSFVWHDSFICVTWLIYLWNMTHWYGWHASFICVTGLIHMGDMTHSAVCHDSFICVTWLIHLCAMTHSNGWPHSFLCVTWRMLKRDMAHAYEAMSHVTHRLESVPTYEWAMSSIQVRQKTWLMPTRLWRFESVPHSYTWHDSNMTRSYVWHDSFIWVTSIVFMCDMTHSYAWLDSCIHGYNILCR